MGKGPVIIAFTISICLLFVMSVLTQTHKPLFKSDHKKHHPNTSISNFLSFPINKIIIRAGYSGCFDWNINEIIYKVNDKHAETENFSNYCDGDTNSFIFKNITETNIVDSILLDLVFNHNKVAGISSYKITENDIAQFHRIRNNNWYNHFHKDKYFYKINIPDESFIDTTGSITIRKILDYEVNSFSTSITIFDIKFINLNNDTLYVNKDPDKENPYMLPWLCTFKNHKFKSFSLNFTKYLSSIIPRDFYLQEVFSNQYFIKKTAEYLYDPRIKNYSYYYK
ncbi:MAG: hypothetical protein H7321_05470 [Bacteroidia bacterium]|nr:hypothetical protein [Bacteroidia bacterium]